MKRHLILLFGLWLSLPAYAQAPLHAPLPEKLDGLPQSITIHHFPNPLYATTDADEPGIYFWKHNTAVLSKTSDLQIEEFGAYIFYNDQWNRRVSYEAKQFDKWFGTKKSKLKAGQPYTFSENWRRDTRLAGGWAMWYVIGTNEAGERVCGIGKLETIGELYKN